MEGFRLRGDQQTGLKALSDADSRNTTQSVHGSGSGIVNAMTVDVEDYFQVSAFEERVDRNAWGSMPSRVVRNVERILEMFDAEGVKATFFVLGWICDRYPQLVQRIADEGHEIASHGWQHVKVHHQDRLDFRNDVERSKKQLEETTGKAVCGYRAASFSIGEDTPWAHDELAAAGYEYSSSVYPIKHDHYGVPDASRRPFTSGSILEIPLSTISALGRNWPCAGGGYFRLMPLKYSMWCVRKLNNEEGTPVVFYFHPWEIDQDQPRMTGLPVKTRFRHYVNLKKFESRLQLMLRGFAWDRMDRVFLDSA